MVQNHLFKATLLVTLLIALGGCVRETSVEPTEFSQQLLKHIDEQELIAHSKSEAVLAEAANSVSKSLYQLASIEHAMHPNTKKTAPPNPVYIGMENHASLDWSGPVEPLLRKVAKASHYQLKVLGVAPAIPIIVSITAQNTPLADIFRDITFQADKQAKVLLYPNKRIIELRYLGA